MGNGLSKEQEQCFPLIQQLFKAARCLPDKGSLDLKIWEKAGQRSPHNRENLDKKRRGLWDGGSRDSRRLLDPSHGSPQLWRASQLCPVSAAGAQVRLRLQCRGAGSLQCRQAAAVEGRVGPLHLPSSPMQKGATIPHSQRWAWSQPKGSSPSLGSLRRLALAGA